MTVMLGHIVYCEASWINRRAIYLDAVAAMSTVYKVICTNKWMM